MYSNSLPNEKNVNIFFFQLNLVYVIETLGNSFKKLHRIMVAQLQEHIVVMVFIGKIYYKILLLILFPLPRKGGKYYLIWI